MEVEGTQETTRAEDGLTPWVWASPCLLSQPERGEARLVRQDTR